MLYLKQYGRGMIGIMYMTRFELYKLHENILNFNNKIDNYTNKEKLLDRVYWQG